MLVFSIIFAVLLFSILIFLHELGHFVAAKLSGVQVNEFSMFMGPAIFKKQKGETLYSIRCIPIGGYCAMEGEDADTDNPRSFQKAAWWKRLIILVAGSFMNLVSGFVLFAIFFSPIETVPQPVIASAEPQCTIVAEDALHVGDRILQIDGKKVYVTSDISVLAQVAEFRADVLVERNGEKVLIEEIDFQLHPFVDEDTGETSYRFGIMMSTEERNFWNYLDYAWKNTINNIRMVPLSLQMLFTGKASVKDLMGPVGIVTQMSTAAQQAGSFWNGIRTMVYFGAFLAANLGVMNLLPIPALDGGRVVGLLLTTVIEKVTGKKVNAKVEGYIHGAFMVLLFALMALIFFKDVFVIFKR